MFMVSDYSPCGIVCDDCPWFSGEKMPRCPGCHKVDGKPFWGGCETYSCVQDRGVGHCGECGEFPCSGFMERFDPREGPVNAVVRAGLLAYRRRHGDDEAVELTRRTMKDH
jgi:hypothetical protein